LPDFIGNAAKLLHEVFVRIKLPSAKFLQRVDEGLLFKAQ
jgi:hypothetical protein